jgi:hypothetical protein
VPADNRLGFHDDHYREQRPEAAGQTGYQPSVEGLKAGSRHGAPKDDDLLAQDKVLAEE